ncbi:MAG: c-type cytochrome [Alphaproteobacteria bacterium]
MRRAVVPVVFAAMSVASCGGEDSYESKVSRGKAVFEAECSSCHGPTGGGTAWGGDLRAKLKKEYSYAKFSSIVMSGRTRTTETGERKTMPRFAGRPVVRENLEEIYLFLNEESWPPNAE